jgi:urease subunit alpha
MPHEQNHSDIAGPTAGDRVRLADTDLFVEVEKDFAADGSMAKTGGGTATRDPVGRSQRGRGEGAADTVITGALLIDHWGIVKADVGLKDGQISGIGKAGDPDTQPGIDIIVGAGTETIAGEGKILTAGAVDANAYFITPRQIEEALAAGVTTMIGGGTGPVPGGNAATATPGPWHLARMIQAAEGFAVNLGFTGSANASLPRTLEEEIEGGAMALKLHGDLGASPAAIDNCLAIADTFDVQAMIDGSALNDPRLVDDVIAAFKGRTVHADAGTGTPGLLKLASLANVLPSFGGPARTYAANAPGERTERSVREGATAAGDILHDMGALSMIASGEATGRAGEVILRTFQMAHKMRVQRGPLSEETGNNDNFRVKRYIAKITINPAITHGIDEWVGSIEIGKLADLVLWSPALFGVKPDLVLKLGTIASAPAGDPNAAAPASQPERYRPMFAAFGRSAVQSSVTFVSRAALATGIADKLGVRRTLLPVHNTRSGISKESMVHNAAMPKIEVDPATHEVRADGERLAGEATAALPLAQRYFLF